MVFNKIEMNNEKHFENPWCVYEYNSYDGYKIHPLGWIIKYFIKNGFAWNVHKIMNGTPPNK